MGCGNPVRCHRSPQQSLGLLLRTDLARFKVKEAVRLATAVVVKPAVVGIGQFP